jgi:predicted dienelactone hydrolase
VQLGWLASALAAQGYIVAGVNHHGNTALEPYTPQGFARVWERPQDLTVMLDRLLDDPILGPRIDLGRVGAAGFSIGGYTALALAGGVLDLHALQAAYRDSGRPLVSLVPPEFPDAERLVALLTKLADEDSSHRRSYRDGRVRAAFVIAPAFGEAFTAAGLAPIDIPVKIVVGAADTNTPPSLNAMRYAGMIEQADLVILDGDVGHYTFLAEGTPLGQRLLPEFCVDHPSVDRAAVHRQVSRWAMEFFEQYLTVE